MPLEIVTVPCLSDNYAFLIHDAAGGRTALVDAPEADAVRRALDARGWQLDEIWLTHHHGDHVEGVADLVAAHGAQVTGNAADSRRLPPLDRPVEAGASFEFAGHAVTVIDAPGHTVGHVAFHIADAAAVFTADSLMALGCGRLFEGTPAQMWDTLSRISGLPDDTTVYSGHEYTATNARFAATIDPHNGDLTSRSAAIDAARADGTPTVPSSLAEEKATNPFLRAHLPELKAKLGVTDSKDVEVFAEIRRRKDAF